MEERPKEGLSLEQLDGLTEAYLAEGTALVDAPDPNWLIEGLLLEESITLIVGESGSAKSWIAYDLIRAALTGTPWLARSVPLVETRAALFNYDNPTSEVKRRFYRLGIPLGKVRVHSAGVNRPPGPNKPELLRLPHEFRLISQLVEHNGIKVVVFDSLRQAHFEKEQDSQAMGEVMASFRAIANLGVCVVILHHSAKGEDKGGWETHARGSGEIAAHADTIIETMGGEQLVWTKTRGWNMGDANKIRFRVEDDGPRTRVVALGVLPGVTPIEASLREVEEALAKRSMGSDELMRLIQSTREGIKRVLDWGLDQKRIQHAPRAHLGGTKFELGPKTKVTQIHQ